MSSYRVDVTEESDFSDALQLMFYILAFSMLLPIGVCWLIYKLIAFIVNAYSENRSNHPAVFEEYYNRLLELKKLRDAGYINEREFYKKRNKFVKRLTVKSGSIMTLSQQMSMIKELYDLKLMTYEEYEERRSKLARKMN